MVKRKRTTENELEERLAHHRKELFRMLKVAKGFERQRMAKRLHDPKSSPDKKARIEKEIVVLKSLDLQSVANAHLCASLLKIKAVAESPKLPEEIKHGVPKPDISEEERIALHNVTSGLYNQTKVREAAEKALVDICRTLRVPPPDKEGKPKKGDKKGDATTRRDVEEQPAEKNNLFKTEFDKKNKRAKAEIIKESSSEEEGGEETEWNGISDEDNEEEEEQAVSRFADRLGSSGSVGEGSDGEEYDTANEELDPMEITDLSASEDSEDEVSLGSSGSDGEDFLDVDDSEEASEKDSDESDSAGVSPPPKVLKREAKKNSKVTDTKYLPSLMGGYVSGSESEASDIDMAPPTRKNRRGQRARQAIWEKKYKEKAKHVAQQKSGRDDGWDLKRGAVDNSERTPWKKGIKTPFEKRSSNANSEPLAPRRPRAPPKKDDEGPLHPSWEARKKAKEAQETAAFQGKRVVFD